MPIEKSLLVLVACTVAAAPSVGGQAPPSTESRVIVTSRGWQLIGDLRLPAAPEPAPAVLLLNGAADDRTVYRELAQHLADSGVASLRLDLAGHGESTNLGRFIPGEVPRSPMIWDAEVEVVAAQEYLRSHPRVDGARIGVVGASYSGEEMAEAGRLRGYMRAYAALSPGSFSEESISGIDASGSRWLFVAARDERFLREITASVQRESRTVEVWIVPGTRHVTRLLRDRPALAERVAAWLARALR